MNSAIQKALIIGFPFVAIFLCVLAFNEFKNYAPTLNLKSEGEVAGEKIWVFNLQYPDSQIISQSFLQENTSITQQTVDNPDKVLEYYENMLIKNGWKMWGPAIYKKVDETITITLTKDSNNITIVNVDNYSAVPVK
ncbi:MAG: hypothetical protein ABIB98_02950 [bacterium]